MTDEQERLIEDKLKLVKHIVGKFDPTDAQTEEDLYQYGCLGLVKAATWYRPTMKCSFTTYAHICIRNEISRALQKDARHNVNYTSYDAPVPGTDLSDGTETITDINDYSELAVIAAQIRRILQYCNARECFILVKRASGYTLQEIGDMFGLTRERVRQIEDRAKRKIARELKDTESEGS